jgi:localization factor PodJL
MARRTPVEQRPVREDRELPAGIGKALAQFNRRLDQIAADIARNGASRPRPDWTPEFDGAPDHDEKRTPEPPAPVPLAPVESAQDLSGLEEQLRKITEQIAGLNRPCRIDDAVFALRSDLADISRAFSDAMPRQAIELLEKEVRALAASVERGRELGVDGSKLALLEQGIAELREALRKLDPTENVLAIGRAMQELTRKIDHMTAASQNPAALQKIDQEIAGLRDALRSREPAESLREIGRALQELTRKVEQIGAAAHSPAALQKLDQDIAGLREALLRNLEPAKDLGEVGKAVKELTRKIDQIAPANHNPLALQKLDQVIAGLRGIVGHMASNETMAKLAAEVRNLAARFELLAPEGEPQVGRAAAGSIPDVEALARAIGQQLEPELAKQIESGRSHHAEMLIRQLADEIDQRFAAHGAAPPELPDLVAEVRALAEKLDRLQAPQGDRVALGGIEDRIVNLAAKLDESGVWLERLDAIERGMADLLVYLGDVRRTKAQQQQPQDAHDGARIEPPQSNGNLRDAGDLPMVDGAVQTPPQSTAVAVTAASSETEHALHASTAADETAAMDALVAARDGETSPMRGPVRRPVSPDLPPDTPIEPRQDAALPRTSAAERGSTSEAALNVSKPVAREVASQFETLIAARRAALAASAEAATAGLAASRSGEKSVRGGSRRLRDYVRWTLLGASIIIIVLGAVKVGVDMWGTQEPSEQPATSTAPAGDQSEAGSGLAPAATPSTAPVPGSGQGRPTHAPAMPMPGDSVPTAPPADSPSNPSMDGTSPVEPLEGSSAREPLEGKSARPMPEVTGALSPSGPDAPRGPVELPASIGGPALRASALAGNPAAEYEIALRYAEGRGVTPNIEESARWLERAAKSGFAPAQFRLGSLYDKGGGLKRDRALARTYYTAAAEQGHAKAMHNLAVLYAEGLEGRPNYRMAAHWFRKAAEHGIADSQYNLAILYIRGIGIEQNLAEAYKWFALAANQGDHEAARKRDEVAERLDEQTLNLAQQKVRAFVVLPQPERALSLRVPRGGWDRADVNGEPPRVGPRPALPETPQPPASLLSPHPL